MKIDLHTHSRTGSGCGHQSVEEIVLGAISSGLDAVCLTDHNNLSGAAEAGEAVRFYGFPVFMGMEVTTLEGDIIAFGPLPEDGFGRVTYSELRRIIDLQAFALIPAHPYRAGGPFREMPEIVRRYPEDFAALEVCSFNMTPEDSERTLQLAEEVGRPVVANSDSHAPDRPPGSNYNILGREVKSVEQLVRVLNAGDFDAAPCMALSGMSGGS